MFDRIGLFNQTLGGGEDYDLYLRIVREFPIICHPTVIAEYRSHESVCRSAAISCFAIRCASLKRKPPILATTR